MELPISKPSRVSYADELEFSKLLEELERKKHNGFIRVTHGSEEGYILFNEGNQIAASYDQQTKIDAIDKIKSVMDKVDTLIEVFDLKPTQIDYIKDLNKVFLISEDSEVYNMIEELKGKKISSSSELKLSESVEEDTKETEIESEVVSPEPEPVTASDEVENKPKDDELTEATETKNAESKNVSEPNSENSATGPDLEVEPEIVSEVEKPVEPVTSTETVSKEVDKEPATKPEIEMEPSKPELDTSEPENNISESETVSDIEEPAEPEIEKTGTVSDEVDKELASKPEIEMEPSKPELDTSEPEKNISESEDASKVEKPSDTKLEESKIIKKEPVSREALMKKYGLKEVNEEEVENILESYKGGTISIEDLERIELTLMNKIKKSIMGIPKIKGVEVMVFLDNVRELTGTINIITEYGGTGFLSRIVGSSDKIKLENRIYTITEMEIKKSFREYPEIINNFEINIEIH
ncbi:MAG: hypothetical protein Kow0019_07260 [Methanobacteriaceae archaeon]